MKRKKPWQIRLHFFIHRDVTRHFLRTYNDMITVDKVRVIDDNGENIGVMYTREAIEQAAEVGLDLVEVSPNADPPVCKFLDVGKYRYEAQKKANACWPPQATSSCPSTASARAAPASSARG